MARSLKFALWITFGAVVTLGSAPFWAAALIDWNSQRERLAGLLTEASGLDVAINGDIEVESLLPRARVSIGGIAATSGIRDETATVSVQRVGATIEIWPLLEGILEVTSLHIDGVRLTYTVDEHGRHQWIERYAPALDAGSDVGAPDAGEAFIRDVRLADVQISNAELLYDNELTQQTVHASEASLRATLASLADPLELSGEFDLNERPVVLTAVLDSPGTLIRGEGARLTTTVKSALLQVGLDLETWLSPHFGANGSIDIDVPSVGQLAEWLKRPLGQMDDPGALRLSGRVSSTETRATLHALALSSPDWDLTVSGHVAFDEVPTRLSLNIEGDRVDLDRYLPRPAEAPRRLSFGPPRRDRTRDGLDDPIDLSVLQDFQGEIRIALDGLKVRDFEVGRTAFRAKLKDSVVALELGELSLYGGRLLGQMNFDASGPEPELDARLAIDRVDLDSFYEARQTNPIIGGEINGAINVTSRGRTPRELFEALNGAVLLELDPNQEIDPSHPMISKANVQLIIPQNGENPYLLGRLFYAGEDVTFDIETAPLPKVVADRGFALDVSLETNLASLTYKGDVYRSPIFSLNGDLNAALPSAGRLAQWLGAPLPRDPGPVTLKASFDSDGTEGRIREAFIQGEDLNAEVSGDFDFSGEVSKFNLQAKTGVLRIDRYLPELAEGPAEEPGEATSSASAERETVFLLEDLPEEPLDLAAFRQLTGQIEIASEGVVLPGFVVGRVALGFQTKEGLASLDIERLAINGSTLTGKARFDGRQSEVAAELSLRGAKIDLDTLLGLEAGDGPGLGKGDIAITAQAKGGSLKDLLSSFAPLIELNLASVALDEHHSLEAVAISARSDGLAGAAQLSGRAELQAKDRPKYAIAVDITSDPVADLLGNETFGFRGTGSLDDVQLEITAEIDTPLTHAKPALEIRSAGDSLAAIASILETELPVAGPYKFAGRIVSDGAKTELSDLDLTLGRSKVSGRLSLDAGDERPTIAGRLAFESLDLTEYYGDEGFEDLLEEDGEASGPATEEWIFDETPLPFELLSEADITDFKVEIANLKVDPDVVITDISSTLSLKDATLQLSELRGRIYDGDVTGGFKAFHGAGAPAVDLELKGANLDYGVFLHAFGITERLRGRLDVQLDLDGHGTSLRALASGLHGRIDVNAKEGEFDRKMLGLMAFGTGSILGPLVGKDDKGKLECIVTTFTFEDGLGDTLVQYYETSSFSMAGKGVIDLKTETLDFLYNPKARETSLMKLATPFRVSGSLRSPDVTVDTGGTLLAAAKTAGTIASFINPLVGLGVLAGQAAMNDRNGCETANLAQRGEIPAADPDPESNQFLKRKDRN